MFGKLSGYKDAREKSFALWGIVKENDTLDTIANKYKIPVIPRGAGTNMVGACVCTQGGIVLNFSKMNKILEIN